MAVTRPATAPRAPDPVGAVGSLLDRARAWSSSSHGMVSNTVSLIGTTGITSGLGYLYWMVAARLFEPAAIGFAGASISALGLLGAMGVLGLGTLLIGELPRRPGEERALVARAVALAGAAGLALGVIFALATPLLADDLSPLASSAWSTLLFGAGVSLTTMTIVLDQALVGLLRGPVQFWRNAAFAASKLAALVVAGLWLVGADGETIVVTWVGGMVLSMVVAVAMIGAWPSPRAARRATDDRPSAHAPARSVHAEVPSGPRESVAARRRRWGWAALTHHALNVALQVPFLALPILATSLLSVTANAYFYIAWVLAGFVFVVPGHLTMALYAAGARAPETLARRMRATLALGLLAAGGANLVLLVAGGFMLGLFGGEYAEQALACLQWLALWAFPLLLKDHYVVVCRLEQRVGFAALALTAGGLLELTLAAVGANAGGLAGLSIGWLLGGSLQAALLLPTVYRAAFPPAGHSRVTDRLAGAGQEAH